MNNYVYQRVIFWIFDKEGPWPFMGKGLTMLNIDIDKKLNCEVIFDIKLNKILGLFNETLEWVDNSIWGGQYFDEEDLTLTGEYKFFFMDGKPVYPKRIWSHPSTLKIKSNDKTYGKEVLSIRDDTTGKYYCITSDGSIYKEDSLENEGII
jgi:hypothetical protein